MVEVREREASAREKCREMEREEVETAPRLPLFLSSSILTCLRSHPFATGIAKQATAAAAPAWASLRTHLLGPLARAALASGGRLAVVAVRGPPPWSEAAVS